MKKRILFLVMLLGLTITRAQQPSGTQFTVGDMIYEVNTDNTTVSIHNTNNEGNLTGAIVVPTTINDGSFDYTITVIKSAAYNDEAGITSLVVQGDTEIQLQAFRNCYGLLTVDVSAVVTKKIGNSAFLNCTALTSANFDGVTSIGNQIFSGCTNLTTFSANALVSSGGGTSMFLNCTSLTTVNLPVALAVGNKMFKNCTSLISIDMPKATTALPYGFQNCNALTTVNLPLLETTGTQMFVDCSSLVSLDLPALTQTGNLSFYKCSSLKYLNLPSLITANTGSFNSTGLESIIFPASFTTFGAGNSNHFANAASLKHIAFTSATPVDISGRSDMFTGTALSTIIVPEGAASAYDSADVWTDFSIVEGTLSKTTSDITYSRNLGTENWYLVASPVNNEMYNDTYVTANSIDATGNIAINNAIATYTTNGNTWDYMEDGEDLPFTPGVGYSVKRENATGAGSISFTGSTLNSGDVNNVPVSLDADGYNLLGNPYLTNINSGAFLTANTNLSGEIWLFNQATGNYETHVTGDDKILAPAQGFFVKATSGADVDFTEAIQNTSTGTFQKTTPISKIKLLINSGDTERFAKIYFTESATTGFDKGWDGERFSGISNKMDVFTQLLENNIGKNYQTQSLPNTSIQSTIVPVGLISEAGKQITFSAENTNLPENLNVFIEDRTENIFTNLNESNYKITLSEALNGVGRFYIHTSAKSILTVDTASTLESISIYKMKNATLKITGLAQGKASVKLFNVLGKQMMNTSFESNGVKEISLQKLATGIYIVQLETEAGKLSKKIILE